MQVYEEEINSGCTNFLYIYRSSCSKFAVFIHLILWNLFSKTYQFLGYLNSHIGILHQILASYPHKLINIITEIRLKSNLLPDRVQYPPTTKSKIKENKEKAKQEEKQAIKKWEFREDWRRTKNRWGCTGWGNRWE